MEDILCQDLPPSIPEGDTFDTSYVFRAVEPDIARKTHARRLNEKSAIKGQRLLRPERERYHHHHHEQTDDTVRPKRVAKLAPIKMLREVYLPKLVTIGNLAKILNVRLGECGVLVQTSLADQLAPAPLQRALLKAGFEYVNYDYCALCIPKKSFETEAEAVLTADDAALIAPDFGCNAIMNEEAAFDIYPPCVPPYHSK